MINKEELLNKLSLGQGIYNSTINEYSPVEGFILKNRPNMTYLELWYPDGKCILDSPDYITSYSIELLDKQFDSILIAGLGIGAQAYVCQDFADVDVVENDQNVININNQLGFLDVNIIKDDIFTFSTEKTYDVILFDIWWEEPDEETIDELVAKFTQNLNPGGFIYFPLLGYKVTKKQD